MRELPDIMIEQIVRDALLEDLGRAGDITSQALLPTDLHWKAVFKARKQGIIVGLSLARLAFHLIDSQVLFEAKITDGNVVQAGDTLAVVSGCARSLLMVERVALNFICHLSGVATSTHQLVQAIKPHSARICCTRKTTPNLRVLEKHAVLAGGGSNHRLGLDDAMLIKDNHIAAVGDLRQAVLRAREQAGHMVKIELEVDTLDQLQAALDLPIDAVLLDNMTPDLLRRAVVLVGGRFVTEASGGVTVDNAQAIAASGVDIISVGWLTHSAPILDVALDSAM